MLDYDTVYRVTPKLDGQERPREAFVAMGVLQLGYGAFKPEWFRFCTNMHRLFNHGFFGWAVESAGRVEVTDVGDEDRVWIFEPLTLVRMQEMLAVEALSAGGESVEFDSEDDMADFFEQQFLPVYWQEWKDSGKFAVDLKAMVDVGDVP